MKKFLLIGAAAMALPTAAMAADGTVTIDGSVADRCLFTTPNKTLSLGELAGSDGKLDPAKVDGKNETLVGWCNGTAATMTVTANALANSDSPGAPPSGFDRVINFTATANANSVDATDTSSSAGAGTPATVGLFTGNILVTLSSSATVGNGLLVAGDYDGSVLVTLAPNVSFNLPTEE